MKGKLNPKYLNIFLVFTLIFSLAFTSVGNVAQANDDTYAKKEFSTDTLTQMKTIIEKQEQALNEKPLLHRSLQDVSGDEEAAARIS